MTQQYAKLVIEGVHIIKKKKKFVFEMNGRTIKTLTNREMFEIANWVLGRIAFDVKG